jgi:hypothetical protein
MVGHQYHSGLRGGGKKKLQMVVWSSLHDVRLMVGVLRLTCEPPPNPKTKGWVEFIEYFKKTWIERFDSSLWNVSECFQLNLVGRTNNALERYNRRLNEQFSNAHPSIGMFIQIIKQEESFYSSQMRLMRSGEMPREKIRAVFEIPNIPNEFILYKANQNTK